MCHLLGATHGNYDDKPGGSSARRCAKCMDPPCDARENVRLECCTTVSGLVLELRLRTIMEIRARPSSLPAMPRRAIWGISFRMRWKDHFSISYLSPADLGGQRITALTSRFSLSRALSFLTHAAWDAGFIDLASKLRPPWRTSHAMRAILLASAIASLKRLSRRAAASVADRTALSAVYLRCNAEVLK